MKLSNDEACLQALCQGNSAVLREIYRQYSPMVKNWVLNNNGDSEDAQDLMQEVLLAIYDRYCGTDFQFRGNFGGLLMVIAKRIWFDRLKQKKRNTDVRFQDIYRQLEEDPEFEAAEEAVLQKKRTECLEKVFQQLSDQCQRLLKLYAKGQDDPDMIAAELNISNPNAVYQARHRCLNRWKQLFHANCK